MRVHMSVKFNHEQLIRKRYELAERFANQAGAILQRSNLSSLSIKIKSDSTPISKFDKAIDELFREMLFKSEFKHDQIISEEGSRDFNLKVKERWILDSIDGTANFINRRSHFAVSLGYWEGTRPVFGFIVKPENNSFITLSALRNHGMFLDNATFIPPVAARNIGGADFNYKTYDPSFDIWMELRKINPMQEMRVLGSIACGISEVATGKLSFYLHSCPKLWDVAAGIPIILGARMTTNKYIIDMNKASENNFELGMFIATQDKATLETIREISRKIRSPY